MSNKRKEEFYKNLPRKEVQRSCNQRGLPQEGASGFCQKATHSNAIHNTHGGTVKVNHQVQQRDMGCHAWRKNSTSMDTYSESPAVFEFYVSSEDGIKLSVDLSSSSSDWINRYNGQDLLSETMGTSKSKKRCQEFEQIGESGKNARSLSVHHMGVEEIKGVDLQAEHSPSSVVDKCSHASDNGGVGNQYMLTTNRVPRNTNAYVSRIVEKDQKHISSTTNSDSRNKVSNIELCTKDEFSATRDSDITDVISEKTADAITSIAMEHQRSKNNSNVHKKPFLQKSCDLEKTSVIFSGYQASSSMEMQKSDDGNLQNGASCSSLKNVKLLAVNNIRTNHDKFINSSEGEPFSSQILTCSREQGRSNAVNRTKSLV